MRFVVGECVVPVDRRHEQNKNHSPHPLSFWFSLRTPKRDAIRGGSTIKNKSFAENLSNPVSSLALAQQVPIEYYRVRKVTGDGRCLFRALAQGVSRLKDIYLTPTKEEIEADNLRMAVQEALCTTKDMKHEFRDVIQMLDSPLPKYCNRLRKPDFWGGEPELLVLSKLLRTPIFVYKKETEFGRSGSGFIKIVEYGRDSKKQKYPPVKLLYTGSNHYDLLLTN